MTKFSANLGFLWSDLDLPDAIRAAKFAGFDAVECHWPYETEAELVKAVLNETGLTMLGLNTRRGNLSNVENGLTALPDRITEARAAIDEAIAYATSAGIANIHVMAGFSSGAEARSVFESNLNYACERALKSGKTILIEPLNKYDAPGYFLQTTDQAVSIIESVGCANLKLMFDCYHVQLMEGDICNHLKNLYSKIGHIQFASVPDRGPPNDGELSYSFIFEHIKRLGYVAPLGAEYKPVGRTEDSLCWMKKFGD